MRFLKPSSALVMIDRGELGNRKWISSMSCVSMYIRMVIRSRLSFRSHLTPMSLLALIPLPLIFHPEEVLHWRTAQLAHSIFTTGYKPASFTGDVFLSNNPNFRILQIPLPARVIISSQHTPQPVLTLVPRPLPILPLLKKLQSPSLIPNSSQTSPYPRSNLLT